MTSTRSTKTNTWLVLLVVAGLAAAAVIGALIIGGSGDDEVSTDGNEPTPALNAGPVEVTGAPLPLYDLPDRGVGLPAPAFSGVDFSGAAITVEADGPMLVGFFAHWCSHCQAEIPEVVDWLATDPGIDVVAVSTAASEDEDNWPPSEWFDREGWTAPVVVDSPDRQVAAAYGLSAFPYWVAIDGDGNIVARTTGRIGTPGLEALADLARS